MDDMNGLFIVIPTAAVTDDALVDGSKLLYGFILALAQTETQYCYATNAYLGKVLNTTERSIRNYVKNLKDAGYIDVEIIRDERGEVKERRIRCMVGFKGEKIERSPEAKAKKAKEEQKHAYGSQKNVMLTDKQYAELKALYPTIDDEIENMSLYCSANGKPYKNYYSALLNWMKRRAKDEKPKGSKWDGVDY